MAGSAVGPMTCAHQHGRTYNMRRRRLVGWLFLALGGLLASLFVAVSPATATSTPPPKATMIGFGPGLRLTGTATSGDFTRTFAGLFKMQIVGTNETTYAFCIELAQPISTN